MKGNTDPNKGSVPGTKDQTNSGEPGTDMRDVAHQLADHKQRVTSQRDTAIAGIGQK